jgi:hypothetical protein
MSRPNDGDDNAYVLTRGEDGLVPVMRPNTSVDLNADMVIQIEPRTLSRTKSVPSANSSHNAHSKAPNTSSRVVAIALLLPIALAVLFSSIGIGT